MDNFQIQSDEVLFFIDYNNTLVNYDRIEDRLSTMSYEAFRFRNSTSYIPLALNKALNNFKNETGLKPVICIVTNASMQLTRGEFPMMLSDFYDIFIKNIREDSNRNCLNFIKYVIMNENDGFFRILQGQNCALNSYEYVEFDDEIKSIKKTKEFHKFESVERMLRVLDPENISNHLIFSGDRPKDDYPMVLVDTPEGVNKFFIRPSITQKMSLEKMRIFADAKGVKFSSFDKNHHLIKHFTEHNINYLTDEDREKLRSYGEGVKVILTEEKSKGLIQGINIVGQVLAGNLELSNEMPQFD